MVQGWDQPSQLLDIVVVLWCVHCGEIRLIQLFDILVVLYGVFFTVARMWQEIKLYF